VRHRHRPEQIVHRSVVAHLRVRSAPGTVFLHPANGGARSKVEGAIFRSLGVAPGAPDLLLWQGGRSFALELKSEAGHTTDAQVDMLARLKDAGVLTAVARGIDEAMRCLETWGLLRGKG
jgi:hypothetical protein